MKSWFAVRCLFETRWPTPPASGHNYEERLTLWHCKSIERAIEKAEREAADYASLFGTGAVAFLGLSQAYQLDASPGHGAEIFSLFRHSLLTPERYLDTFFATGQEAANGHGLSEFES